MREGVAKIRVQKSWVCVWEMKKERERKCVCVCLRERERERERERKRKREWNGFSSVCEVFLLWSGVCRTCNAWKLKLSIVTVTLCSYLWHFDLDSDTLFLIVTLLTDCNTYFASIFKWLEWLFDDFDQQFSFWQLDRDRLCNCHVSSKFRKEGSFNTFQLSYKFLWRFS
jgi:hypothetical protein